jgi:hypothetical protein
MCFHNIHLRLCIMVVISSAICCHLIYAESSLYFGDDVAYVTSTGAMAAHLVPSLANDVATYLGFGEHRAGMASEGETAAWIAARLHALGYVTETQHVPIRTMLAPGGQLNAGVANADVFPQWLPPAHCLGQTLAAPFLSLAAGASGRAIRMVTTPAPLSGNWSPAQDALVAEAVGKGAVALVLAPDDRTGELYVSNQHNPEPLPIPVVLLARRALAEFAAVAERQDVVASVSLRGSLVDAHAINVVARKGGRGRTLVLSTPLTGWFQCGGERGPGVAVLLRMAAIFARTERPVIVLGTGSHEIGHYGMAHFLRHGAPMPDEIAFWFHFGASLACTRLDAVPGKRSPKHLVGTAQSEVFVRSALEMHTTHYVNGSARTAGESGQVIGGGYLRFAGMVGTFPTFHTPADRGEAIDYAQLELIAAASAGLIQRFAEMPDGNVQVGDDAWALK